MKSQLTQKIEKLHELSIELDHSKKGVAYWSAQNDLIENLGFKSNRKAEHKHFRRKILFTYAIELLFEDLAKSFNNEISLSVLIENYDKFLAN